MSDQPFIHPSIRHHHIITIIIIISKHNKKNLSHSGEQGEKQSKRECRKEERGKGERTFDGSANVVGDESCGQDTPHQSTKQLGERRGKSGGRTLGGTTGKEPQQRHQRGIAIGGAVGVIVAS